MSFVKIISNQTAVQKIIDNSIKRNVLSHAYIFEGTAGCGTMEMAQYFAMSLLCGESNKPCYQCNDCQNIINKNHLAVLYIEPINDLIRKDQIVELVRDFSMSSIVGNVQVCIIKDADKMNIAASNALLKFLEEPESSRYAILLTTNHRKMLSTIISRAQLLLFKALPVEFMVKNLEEAGIDIDMSYILANITNDISMAQSLIGETNITKLALLAKKIMKELINGKDPFATLYLERSVLLQENDRFFHRVFLDILILMNQELIKIRSGNESKYFSDIYNNVKMEEINVEKIIARIDTIHQYMERLNTAVNLDLFYSSLILEL